MRTYINIDKVICFFLALGSCFVIDLDGLRMGNYLIQQFIIIIPSLLLMINYTLLKKQRIHITIIGIIIGCICIFLITSFKFGINLGDIVSLFGFLIIPIMIIIFNNIDEKNNFVYYYVLIFSMLEVFAIGWIIKEGAILNVWKTIGLRQIFYIWPNHFAMMSAIKFGFVMILSKNKYSIKFPRLLTLLSIVTIFLTLSRTGIIMLFIIFLSIKLLNYKENRKLIKRYKKTAFLLLIFIMVLVSINIISFKNLSPGATTKRTIEGRVWRWASTLEAVKKNIFLGIGFRSTIKIVGEDIGSTHNDYLDILLKSGIIGFSMIYGFFFNRLRVLYKNKEYELVGVFLAILAGSFVQNPLKNISVMVVFSMLISNSYINNKENKKLCKGR